MINVVEKCGKNGRPAAGLEVLAEVSGVFCREGRGTESGALRACSACAGDYEDPERTARWADEQAGEPRDEEDARVEEFPAEEM